MKLSTYVLVLGTLVMLSSATAIAQIAVEPAGQLNLSPDKIGPPILRGESEFELVRRGFTSGGGFSQNALYGTSQGVVAGSSFSIVTSIGRIDTGKHEAGSYCLEGGILVGGCALATGCGDGQCDPEEDSCTCPSDCGDPPTNESISASCDDGIDNDCDSLTDCDDPDCEADPSCEDRAVPAVSQWGLCILVILLLIGGKICFPRRKVLT